MDEHASTLANINFAALRAYRLGRVRAELARCDFAGALLYDPINIRYATDSSNMQLWTMHTAARYLFVATTGPVILFDFHGCGHLSEHLDLIDEIRPAVPFTYFLAGTEGARRVHDWASEIADLMTTYGGGNRRIAVDRCDPDAAQALIDLGLEIGDGQGVLERARMIKSAEEIQCMRIAIAACEAGMAAMRANSIPGATENEVWSHLHQVNIAMGGEWIETRLLAAGPRTNPWFHECGPHAIENGDMLSFDTDLIGPTGYCADISRSWLVGDAKPTDEQKRLYGLALEQIDYNMRFMRPGVTLREITEQAWPMPDDFVANRYSVIAHGVGLCDEYPSIYYPEDFVVTGYDDTIHENMTLCVESYIGRVGGAEGVKIEQQVLVTADGPLLLSQFPLEDDLMG